MEPETQDAASPDATTPDAAPHDLDAQGGAGPDGERPRKIHAVRDWSRKRRITHLLYRFGVLIVGILLVLGGIAMLVLPGPGWAAIIIGLIVLASEFVWAEKLLDPIKRFAKAAQDKALDPRVRRRNLIIAGILVAVAAALGVWYFLEYGLSLQGVTDLWNWVTGG